MTSTNTILNQNYSNFTFDPTTYNTLKPHIQKVISLFNKHKIKKVTLEDCFQISMTLLQIKLDLETIKQITYYTYHLTQLNPKILNQ